MLIIPAENGTFSPKISQPLAKVMCYKCTSLTVENAFAQNILHHEEKKDLFGSAPNKEAYCILQLNVLWDACWIRSWQLPGVGLNK